MVVKQQKRLVAHTSQSVEFIRFEEIVRVEALSSYTNVVTTGKRVVLSKNLSNIEQECPEGVFFRIHRSHLVNIAFVVRFDKQTKLLELKNGDTIPISEKRLPEFLELMEIWGN